MPVSQVELGQRGPSLTEGWCVCSCVTLPSQDQPLVRREEGTFHNVYEVDGINGDTEHEVPEPEDAHEEGKLR